MTAPDDSAWWPLTWALWDHTGSGNTRRAEVIHNHRKVVVLWREWSTVVMPHYSIILPERTVMRTNELLEVRAIILDFLTTDDINTYYHRR